MAPKIQAPRGTRDLRGEECASFRDIEDAARAVFVHYGFREIRTPVFEHRDLFERSVGDETDIVAKELYVFKDRKEREMALRPEGTAGVVRAFIEHNDAAAGSVVKYFYTGPMFRYERPQEGRYREFWQLGCEMFGAKGRSADLEVVDLAARLLERLSVDATLRVNHLGCAGCRSAFSAALVEHFSASREKLCEHCLRRLEKNPLRLLDCKSPSCGSVAAAAPRLSLCAACQGDYDGLKRGLERLGIRFRPDSKLVRGLDYYTGFVFEATAEGLGAQDAVLGGGRYDGLVASLGGPPVPAVGFAIGMDRLARLVRLAGETAAAPRPFLYVLGLGEPGQEAATVLTRALRRAYEACTLAMSKRPEWIEQALGARSLKAHLREADKLGAAYVAILGDDEVAAGAVTFREMSEGHQATISVAGLEGTALHEAVSRALEGLAEERQK